MDNTRGRHRYDFFVLFRLFLQILGLVGQVPLSVLVRIAVRAVVIPYGGPRLTQWLLALGREVRTGLRVDSQPRVVADSHDKSLTLQVFINGNPSDSDVGALG